MVVFVQNGCVLAQEVVLGPCGCIQSKMLDLGKVVVLGKVNVFGQKWFYSGKVVVFDQK